MTIFYLEPTNDSTSDPSWATSHLKEGCWVVAQSEKGARRKVEGATTKVVHYSPGETKLLFSPWLDWRLTTCRVDKPAHNIPSDQIILKSGEVFAA